MKKLLSVLLMLALVLALVPAAVAEEEPITVSVFVGNPREQPTPDNKIFKKIEEELGVKFEFEFLAGDLDETLAIKIAGEDYADLMNSVFGEGACMVLNIREAGAIQIKA